MKHRLKISEIKVLLFLLSVIILAGCGNEINLNDSNNDHQQIYGSGRIVTQERFVSECSGIDIRNVGNVYLIQDSLQSVIIEADDNIIDKIFTYRQNGNLVVGLDDGSYSNIKLNIYVSLKAIKNLIINGAGKIISDNSLNCDNLTCLINGAGNIEITGSGNYLDCSVTGAGNIDSKNYITSKCKAAVYGTGNCTIYVNDELDAYVSGVGSIIYYGNPPIVQASVSGIGQIVRK